MQDLSKKLGLWAQLFDADLLGKVDSQLIWNDQSGFVSSHTLAQVNAWINANAVKEVKTDTASIAQGTVLSGIHVGDINVGDNYVSSTKFRDSAKEFVALYHLLSSPVELVECDARIPSIVLRPTKPPRSVLPEILLPVSVLIDRGYKVIIRSKADYRVTLKSMEELSDYLLKQKSHGLDPMLCCFLGFVTSLDEETLSYRPVIEPNSYEGKVRLDKPLTLEKYLGGSAVEDPTAPAIGVVLQNGVFSKYTLGAKDYSKGETNPAWSEKDTVLAITILVVVLVLVVLLASGVLQEAVAALINKYPALSPFLGWITRIPSVARPVDESYWLQDWSAGSFHDLMMSCKTNKEYEVTLDSMPARVVDYDAKYPFYATVKVNSEKHKLAICRLETSTDNLGDVARIYAFEGLEFRVLRIGKS